MDRRVSAAEIRRLARLDADAELLGARLDNMVARRAALGDGYEMLARTMAELGEGITACAQLLGRMVQELGELREESQ
jgi:hypothetical protein